jgi:hypothetical protein
MTPSIMTLIIMTLSAYAECGFFKSIMLNVFKVSVIILNVIRLNVIAPSGWINLGLYISRKWSIPFLSGVVVCKYQWAKLNIPL